VSKKQQGETSTAAPRTGLVYVAVVASGASVMIVEILGTRVLRPFFGVSLFVWSALLAVTLASLAAGYFGGGVLVDRHPNRKVLYWLIILAGTTCGLLPLLSGPVLSLADQVGIRAGTLLSAALLFAPTLTLLGMVSPVALRLLAREVVGLGHTAGWVYGLSTLGGLAATLLTGYFLVPAFGVALIFVGVAVTLILIGLAGLVQEGGHLGGSLTLAAPLVTLLGHGSPTLPGFEVLARAESAYGSVSVLEDTRQSSRARILRVDHSIMGAKWMETGESAFAFVHLLEAVRLTRPAGRTALVVGLGTGEVAASLARHEVRSDVVEIDPQVVHFAKEYFAFRPTGDVFTEDARTFVRRTNRHYDFVIHDTFTGGETPEHLLSVEVLEQIRNVLEPSGVLALNVVGATEGELSPLVAAVQRTIRHVFPHVRTFRDSAKRSHELSNIVSFASQEAFDFAPPSPPFESRSCEHTLTHFLAWEVHGELDSRAPLITDANNPLARLSVPVSEAFSEALAKRYPKEFWLL
jgi:spermidine synthase